MVYYKLKQILQNIFAQFFVKYKKRLTKPLVFDKMFKGRGDMAQLVERRVRNAKAVSSNLIISTISK